MNYLFVLNIDKVFRHRPFARALIHEREEAEPPAFLLLLVVHDDDLNHLAILPKEGAEIGLSDGCGKSTEEYLKKRIKGTILLSLKDV